MLEDLIEKTRKLIPVKPYAPDKFLNWLDKGLTPHAKFFFSKMQAVQHPSCFLSPDLEAPKDFNPGLFLKRKGIKETSLAWMRQSKNGLIKMGTARCELRKNLVFFKIVTRDVSPEFLHSREVHDLIRLYFPTVKLGPSRSYQEEGFTLTGKTSRINLEVFKFADSGNLVCDLTLNAKNKLVARNRVNHFLDFFCELHNRLGDRVHLQTAARKANPQDIFQGIA